MSDITVLDILITFCFFAILLFLYHKLLKKTSYYKKYVINHYFNKIVYVLFLIIFSYLSLIVISYLYHI